MTDRLPLRRRSGHGRHAATGPARRPHPGFARVVQTAVAAALVVGIGGLAMNPPVASGAADGALPGYVWSPDFVTQTVADRAVALAARDAARDGLTLAAAQAVERVPAVRAKAAQAQLSELGGDQLAALDQLDQLEQQVDTLVAEVVADRLDRARVSRSGERAAAGPGTDEKGGSAGGDASTAGPGNGSDAGSGAGPDLGSDPGSDLGPGSGSGAGAAGASGATTGAEGPTGGPSGSGDGVAGGASGAGTGPDGQPAAQDAAPGAAATALPVTDPEALSAALPAVASDDVTATALRDALLQLVAATNQVDAAADQAAAKAAERAAWKKSLQGYANGRIPASALCSPSFDSTALLRCDAAEALSALDEAYVAAFGSHLQVSDSYRSYGAQVACRRSKGSLCASPGTSNHGWGVAVDFAGPAHTFGTAAHDWLLANAGAYGWTLPAWARAGGSKPEPWHWEYVG